MHILAPHISCVATEQEFEEAIKTYPEVYVTNGLGRILKHIRLKGNRFIRIEVKEIPGIDKALLESNVIREEINFLPNGRVPSHLLDQIVQFFRQVMVIKKADEEAMAHILWNERDKDSEDRGYRVAIPNQTVSKASVRYEHDHIEKDDIIAVDIHSHNTMSPFFSGTDDNDDKKGIFFSGVFGYLDRMHADSKWRLNINEIRKDASITDIFEVPGLEVKIPAEWLDKVKTQTYIYEAPSPGKYHTPVRGWDERSSRNFSNVNRSSSNENKNGSNGSTGGYASEHWKGEHRYGWEGGCPDLYDTEFYGDGSPGPVNSSGGSESQEKKVIPGNSLIVTEPGSLPPANIRALGRSGVSVEEVDSLPLLVVRNKNQSDEYAYNVAQFGREAAEAYDQIQAYLTDLAEKDDLLLNLMTMFFQMLSWKGQEKLSKEGIKERE